MGNLLTDGQGNVLLTGGNALEVTSSVDSNITPGNIKKDVTILGVTGTYEGSGGSGGFRCTNKIFLTKGPLININENYTHQYTFDGTLHAAGIALFGLHGGNDECLLLIPKNNNNVTYNNATITPGEILFKDYFCEPRYQTFSNNYALISPILSFTGADLNTSVSITNNGLLTITTQYSMDGAPFPLSMMIIFKGTDGNYDFDIFDFRLYYDD